MGIRSLQLLIISILTSIHSDLLALASVDAGVNKISRGQVLEASVRVAFCLVGAPRGLVKPHAVAGLSSNLLHSQLLGLAPRSQGVELTVFALIHLHDEMRERWQLKPRTYSQDEVLGTLRNIISREVHFKTGRFEFIDDPSCRNRVAQELIPCCSASHKLQRVSGMLSLFWVDQALAMVEVHERRNSVKFDWVVRSRPDLACAQVLPSLGQLRNHTIYATVKEKGEMWDVLFLIPSKFVRGFRTASTFVAYQSPPRLADCLDTNRNKWPENALFDDLRSAKVPLERVPLACTLVRATGASTAARDTEAECVSRLSAHAACAQKHQSFRQRQQQQQQQQQQSNIALSLNTSLTSPKWSSFGSARPRRECEESPALSTRSTATAAAAVEVAAALEALCESRVSATKVCRSLVDSLFEKDETAMSSKLAKAHIVTSQRIGTLKANGPGALLRPLPKPLSFTVIAQPRSGGTSHVVMLAKLYQCTELHEMYHGSANQTYANIRTAVLNEGFNSDAGFLTDASIDTPELHGGTVKEFASTYGINRCNVFKLKPDTVGSGVLDKVLAEVGREKSVENYVFLVMRQNVTAQVLSFAAMKSSGDSGRARSEEVVISDDVLRRSIIEICEQRRYMLLRNYDALFLTEDFGSGRRVELPGGKDLVYDPTPHTSYAKQTPVWGSPQAEERFRAFKANTCAVTGNTAY